MATLDTIRDAIPDYARDLKLNLGSVLATTGAPGLTEKQIWAVALASAIASRYAPFTRDIESLAVPHLDAAYVNGARAAASIMGMNNIYYRFLHLVEDPEYAQMPARLRMNVIGNPGIDKQDFELAVAGRVRDQRLRNLCCLPRTYPAQARDESRSSAECGSHCCNCPRSGACPRGCCQSGSCRWGTSR